MSDLIEMPGHCGARIVDVDASRYQIDSVMSELRRRGYATVRAGEPASAADAGGIELGRRELRHRHVALVVAAPDDIEFAVAWLRVLTAASPRAHLVLRWDLSSADGQSVRERRPAYEADSHVPAASLTPAPGGVAHHTRCVQRAARLANRGRTAAAERWQRAAADAARRRGDPRTAATLSLQLIHTLIERGELGHAVTAMKRALDWLDPSDLRADVSTAGAPALIAMGELVRAEAALAAAAVELQLRGGHIGLPLMVARAEVAFWRGDMREAGRRLADADAASLPPTAPGVISALGWSGLVAWRREDAPRLDEAIAALALAGPPAARWRAGLSALALAARGRAREAAAHASACAAAIGEPRCGAAIAAEALIVAGDRAGAAEVLARAQIPVEAALDRALVEWLQRPAPQIDRFIGSRAAAGVKLWGHRRDVMNAWQGMAALVEILQQSDHEYVALVEGCRWVREQGAAEAAAVLAVGGDRLLAADGWRDAELADGQLAALIARGGGVERDDGRLAFLAPIRYCGATIGWAAARTSGPPEAIDAAASDLVSAVRALASAAGPLVRARSDALTIERAGHAQIAEMLGCSPAIAAVRDAIARSALSPFPVLIEGESGTGKELVARALHRLSARRDRRFCALNCAALSDDLAEAELFGYAKGAFTGAIGAHAGLFEDAHTGTLFLDELGELSPRAQAKLLRVLQEGEIRRLGENAPRAVDVRVIAATNQPLAHAVGEGRFRQDLLFRLAVVRIRVPPLRDRLEDVPLLAHTFWREATRRVATRALLGPDAVAALCRHDWPGNVRELQNVVSALAVAAPSRGRVSARHVHEVWQAHGHAAAGAGTSLEQARRVLERQMVAAALARNEGRRTTAARELGLTRQGLAKAMRRLGLGGGGPVTGVA